MTLDAYLHSCKLCASPTHPNTTPDGLLYHLCGECGLIFLDERFHPTFDDAKDRYLLHNNSLESLGYVEMLEGFISKCVKPYKSHPSNVLDFGSGPTPVLAELLKRHGYDVDIYDCHFAPDTPYESRMYDAITATEVLEHLADPYEVTGKLMERLNPGGILSVMTGFHPQDWEAFGKWRYRKDSTHLSFFSKRTMERLAEALEMEILFIDCKNLCVFEKPG